MLLCRGRVHRVGLGVVNEFKVGAAPAVGPLGKAAQRVSLSRLPSLGSICRAAAGT